MDDIETISYLDEDGELKQPHHVPQPVLIQGYETMWLTRLVDQRMITLQRQGAITFALSGRGEEACAVGSAAALHPQDWMYPQYREVGILFWRGLPIQDYVHHMFGNEKDFNLGRQMPNHFGSKERNVVTVSSPIGTHIPQAAGCAYAMRLQNEQAVSVCYFGEGATSEGDFHAGLRFAAVRKTPVLFFCRNNGYAISTPTHSQFATDGVVPEGIGHGIYSVRVDGNDFIALFETVKRARKWALQNQKPVLIEAITYRMEGHSTSDDPTRYRSESERKMWEKRCPIDRIRKYLEKEGLWNMEKERQLIKKIETEIEDAISAAQITPPPPATSLIEHVYFETPRKLKSQFENL